MTALRDATSKHFDGYLNKASLFNVALDPQFKEMTQFARVVSVGTPSVQQDTFVRISTEVMALENQRPPQPEVLEPVATPAWFDLALIGGAQTDRRTQRT